MERFYTVRLASRAFFLLLAVAGIAACGGEDTPGATADTTTVSADTAAVLDAASSAEMDRMVNAYVVAADSLATLFGRLKTTEDVEAAAPKIREWSGALGKFHAQSARYGQPLVDRMGATGADTMLTRLISAREELEKNGAVYRRVLEVEGKEASPAQQ